MTRAHVLVGRITKPPVNTVAPAISPSPDWATLVCTTGSWTGPAPTYTYQWKRAGVNIAGATSNTYNTTGNDGSSHTDYGPTITCEVIATNAGGASSPAASNSLTYTPNAEGASIFSWIDPSTVTPGTNPSVVDQKTGGGYGTWTKTAGSNITASATSLNGTPGISGSGSGYMDSSGTVDLSGESKAYWIAALVDGTTTVGIVESHAPAGQSIAVHRGWAVVVNDGTADQWGGASNGDDVNNHYSEARTTGAGNGLGSACVIELDFDTTATTTGVDITTNKPKLNGVDRTTGAIGPGAVVSGNLGNYSSTLFANRAGAAPWQSSTIGHRVLAKQSTSSAARARLRQFIAYRTGLSPF